MAIRLAPWLALALFVSSAEFIAGLLALGEVGGVRLVSTAHLLYFTLSILFLLWILVLVAGIAVHRRRGLWLLVTAPIGLFWPGILVGFAYALEACVANHSAQAALLCYP